MSSPRVHRRWLPIAGEQRLHSNPISPICWHKLETSIFFRSANSTSDFPQSCSINRGFAIESPEVRNLEFESSVFFQFPRSRSIEADSPIGELQAVNSISSTVISPADRANFRRSSEKLANFFENQNEQKGRISTYYLGRTEKF